MDKIVDYLKQLELSEVEARLYLTLLQTGPTSVRDLAATIDIKRTTAYFYIDQLVEKGLIMKLVRGSKKLVSANEPESLQTLVEQKIASAKTVQQNLPSILKVLNNSLPKSNYNKDAEIKYYKGKNNIFKIYKEAFKANEFRSFVKVEPEETLSPDNPGLFHNAFRVNKELKVWEIIYESPFSRRQAIKILSEHNNRYFYKFMPSSLKWSLASEDILIYDGKVVLVDYKEPLSIVVLESADFYNNFKELFNFIWRIIPKPDK
jgi:transposase